MANINDNIRGKKLFKEGSSKQQAVKGSDGEYTVSKEISDDLTSLTDISDLFNDDAIYQTNRFLLKQVEDLRQDVEELHTFIKDAFGKDSSSAASKGDTGATGPQGPQGATGSAGADGRNGTNGSDASINITNCKGTVSGVVKNIKICEEYIDINWVDVKGTSQTPIRCATQAIKK